MPVQTQLSPQAQLIHPQPCLVSPTLTQTQPPPPAQLAHPHPNPAPTALKHQAFSLHLFRTTSVGQRSRRRDRAARGGAGKRPGSSQESTSPCTAPKGSACQSGTKLQDNCSCQTSYQHLPTRSPTQRKKTDLELPSFGNKRPRSGSSQRSSPKRHQPEPSMQVY